MLARFTFLALLGTLSLRPAQAQQGRPDSLANPDTAAPANGGSRQRPLTRTALPLRATLADEVAESSGLAYISGKLWTLNDGGNPPLLFRLDSTTGRVVQRVRVTNFGNVDWEDLTADARYLYVGDFGNNSGTRRDLRVLRIPRAALGPAADTVAAQAIEFSYPDQADFSPRPNHQNFDCEAFFFANDSLHLFTKNWADLQTRYYTLPATPGTYVARLRGTFNVQGLVTAAALNPAGTVAGLLGYNASDGSCFLWLLSGFRGGYFLQATKRRIELPSALEIGQAEGLCFVGRSRVFISNERLAALIFKVPPQLYALNVGRWLAPARRPGGAAKPAGGVRRKR